MDMDGYDMAFEELCLWYGYGISGFVFTDAVAVGLHFEPLGPLFLVRLVEFCRLACITSFSIFPFYIYFVIFIPFLHVKDYCTCLFFLFLFFCYCFSVFEICLLI